MAANLLVELRKLLDLPETADEVQALAKLKERLTSLNSADPTKFVPIELFQQTVKELNLRNSGMSKDDAEACVEVALQEQLLMPYMKEWAVELCMRDRKSYEDFIIGTGGQQVQGFLASLTSKPRFAKPGIALQARERQRIRSAGGGSDASESDDISKNLGLSADDVKNFGGTTDADH